MSQDNIYTDSLSIGYPSHVVQHDLSFRIHSGEFVCLLGRNGCGKSTLLHTLAGLLPPVSGTFYIGEERASSMGKDAAPERQRALVLTERVSLDNTLVYDVVAMGRYPYTDMMGHLTQSDEEIICESLRKVGLDAIRADGKLYKDIFFNALSDGEKQRVLIAKALAQQTPVILLDEPTAHLDLPNRILVLKLLRDLAHEQNKSILLSTHELEMALKLSDRVLLMGKNGIRLDTPEGLRNSGAFEQAFEMNIFDLL